MRRGGSAWRRNIPGWWRKESRSATARSRRRGSPPRSDRHPRQRPVEGTLMPLNRPVSSIGAALLGAMLCSCTGSQDEPDSKSSDPPIEVEFVRLLSQRHQDYVVALQLCSSTRPLDWVEARRRLELTRPYRVFDEDPELMRK